VSHCYFDVWSRSCTWKGVVYMTVYLRWQLGAAGLLCCCYCLWLPWLLVLIINLLFSATQRLCFVLVTFQDTDTMLTLYTHCVKALIAVMGNWDFWANRLELAISFLSHQNTQSSGNTFAEQYYIMHILKTEANHFLLCNKHNQNGIRQAVTVLNVHCFTNMLRYC